MLRSIAERPTILDVARHCGLSKATVSKAMNAPDGSPLVSDEARAKVMRAVKELGFLPSWRGQSLARKRSQTIAIAYSARVGAVPRGVYWEIVDALEDVLVDHGYFPAFLHLRTADTRVERMLGDGRFDGCITLGRIAPTVLEMVRRHRLPIVLINSDAGVEWPRVNVDDVRGAGDLTRHLIGLGHQRIGYYAGREMLDHPCAGERYAGYAGAMADAGLKAVPAFVGPPEAMAASIRGGGRDAPTAIVDFEHFSALELLRELWRAGLRVPADVSVGTFNDTHPVADVVPPLTTVGLPGRAMAQRAVEMLMRRVDHGELDDAADTVVLRETLVVRESTAAPPSSGGD